MSEGSFRGLALECAAGFEISTLRAVASVESHLNPFAIRDNTTRESWTPISASDAYKIAKARLAKGHSVDLGLMQINSANLAALGMRVQEAFDPCHSLAAAHRILVSAIAAGSSETERKAAILISLSRYNTGRALVGVANGYADHVIAAQGESSAGNDAQPEPQITSTQWDIWGTSSAATTLWVVTADGESKIKRAGAQSGDTRNEGRASASQGEPYELFAYQESKTPKP